MKLIPILNQHIRQTGISYRMLVILHHIFYSAGFADQYDHFLRSGDRGVQKVSGVEPWDFL
jgi:hypothetical protein